MSPYRIAVALLPLGALAFADPKAADEELPAPVEAPARPPAMELPAPVEAPAPPPAIAQADAGTPLPDGGVTSAPEACKPGEAALTVTLLVLLRHPTDKVPPTPAEGLTLLLDGVQARTGVKLGEPAQLCTTPGEHEVTAQGGTFSRSVKGTAPGALKVPIAMATQGPPPGLPPGFGPKLPGR